MSTPKNLTHTHYHHATDSERGILTPDNKYHSHEHVHWPDFDHHSVTKAKEGKDV